MTEQDSTTTDTDSMTQAELMAKLMDTYDVPITLIRYDDTLRHTRQGGTTRR